MLLGKHERKPINILYLDKYVAITSDTFGENLNASFYFTKYKNDKKISYIYKKKACNFQKILKS